MVSCGARSAVPVAAAEWPLWVFETAVGPRDLRLDRSAPSLSGCLEHHPATAWAEAARLGERTAPIPVAGDPADRATRPPSNATGAMGALPGTAGGKHARTVVALYTLWYNFVRIHKTLRVTASGENFRAHVVDWRRLCRHPHRERNSVQVES